MMSRLLICAAIGALVVGCHKPAPVFSAAPTQVLTTPINVAKDPYFSAPWPDDRRLVDGGMVSTDYFPNPYGQATLAATMIQTGNNLVQGWGTAAPTYMPFSGAIDQSTLPSEPMQTDGSVFILNIDPSSPQLGHRATVDFHFYTAANSFMQANVLATRPVPGFPLLPKTQYAVVVTTAVKDVAGHSVGPQKALWDVFVGTPSGAAEEAEATYYKPLITELKREGISLSEVAGASVFTTQATTDEIEKLRDYLLSLPQPTFDPQTLQYDANLSVAPSSANSGYYVFEGTYPAENMQHGTLPFSFSGGDFEYDSSGTPIPGYLEHLRVSVIVPTTPEPAGGWPVVMYSHGTCEDTNCDGYLLDVEEYEALGPTLAENGVVVFGIDQILTGPRSGLPAAQQATGCLSVLPVADCFIDPVNAVAGRNNLRQAALDNVNLRQFISNPATVIPAAANASTASGFTNPTGQTIAFNPAKLGFLGHSQGGLTGALYLPIDPVPLGGVVSGAGGLITGTLMERTVSISGMSETLGELIEGPLFLALPAGETVDWYHPVLALVQTLAEAVDPINSGPYWFNPLPGGKAKSIFTSSGLLDTDTPSNTADFLNAAALTPRILPLAQPNQSPYTLLDMTPVTAPVSGDVMPPNGGPAVTAVFHQYPAPWNHFVIYDSREARHEWSNFLVSLVSTGIATVPVDCTTCTCADGTCADSSGTCDDGTNCNLCSVCECFVYAGNVCPVNQSGECPGGAASGNCTTCNVCICGDDSCPIDEAGDCQDDPPGSPQANCLAPYIPPFDGGVMP